MLTSLDLAESKAAHLRLEKEFRTILNKGKRSAKALCGSPTSLGRSFYSVTEDLFCDMIDNKKLYESCKTDDQKNCFDPKKNELRRGGCGKGEICAMGTAFDAPPHTWEAIDGWESDKPGPNHFRYM
jgi:hypothetical protein